jgi:hypothetical protein
MSHNWIADLYLIVGPATTGTQTNPSVVTIYNGVEWGWVNIPEPASIVLILVGGCGLALVLRRRSANS